MNRNYVITNGEKFIKFSFQVTKSFGLAGKWDEETANNILNDIKNSCKYMRYNFQVKLYTYSIID